MTTFGKGYNYGLNNNLSTNTSQASSAAKANNMAVITQIAKLVMNLMG